MNIKKTLFIMSSALLISACGGGSGGDDDNNTSGSVNTADAAGIYRGTTTYTDAADTTLSTDDLVGFIAPNGEIAFLSENEGAIVIGNISIASDGSFTGSGTEYASDGTVYGSGDVSGSYGAANQSLSGSSFDNDGTKLSDYNLEYDSQLSDIGASFDQIMGSYDGGEINIDSSGNIVINDSGNCLGSGEITIPDGSLNLYRFTVNITDNGCVIPAGSYDGYMSLVDGSLIYLVFTDTFAAYFEL